MTRPWLVIVPLVSIMSLPIIGCGGSDSTTVTVRERVVTETAGSAPLNDGPGLGDDCTAETPIATEVEARTTQGPLQCKEAQRVMEIYFAHAATSGVGSGAGLRVGGWDCITAPPPEQPLAGYCSDAGDSLRKFEIYSVGYAFRPENRNTDCHLPPPNGAGQSNLRATDIDCIAAKRILESWQTQCASAEVSGPCAVADGARCLVVELGYELSRIECRGRPGQLVTFETGA